MVSAADLKCYKTTNGLGGAITATQIPHATPNNLFSNVPNNERVLGEDYYQCCYFKNGHANEAMDNFKLWLSQKSSAQASQQNTPVIAFDGINDYVDLTNDATLWSQSLTKFSFSFWIYPTAGWDGNSRRVVNHGGTSANSFRVEMSGSTVGEIRFMLRDAVPTSFQANTDTLVLNQWNFIICVYDNSLVSDNAKIYVNGVLGDSQGDSNAAINGSFVLQLADSVDDFKGKMKGFKFWKNTALSQTDVDNLLDGLDILVPSPDYWLPMHEGTGNPTDKISGSKVGTLTNGAAWEYTEAKVTFPDTTIKWAFDPILNSIVFDGSNDYVDCTNDATLWSQSLTKFSFSFWIFPTLAWDGTGRRILNHGDNLGHGFSCLLSDLTTGRIQFRCKNSVGSNFDAFFDTFTINQLHHIVCVYDSNLVSANVKIYVDGVLGGTTANLTEILNRSSILTLADSTTDFKGNMKDFRWWTNTALTQQNITDLNNGNDSAVPRPDYHLKMDEGTGNPVDFISRTKTATLTNGAAWQTSAQIIPDKYTAPVGVTWKELGSEPETPDFLKLAAGASFPIWVWYHVNANALSRLDDSEIFSYALDIPQGGTGTGGGTGGTTGPGYHYSPYATMPANAVTVPHSSSLNLSGPWTLACWFRTTKDYTADLAGYLITKGDYLTETAGNNINYALLISTDVDPNNVLEVLFENSSGNNFYNVSGVKVNDGIWHLGVGTWDGNFTRIYVDGVLKNSENFSGQTPDINTRDLIIGGHEDFMTYQGDQDEVRIWNVALTGEEIQGLYNGIVPRTENIIYENLFGGSDTGTGGGGGTGGNPPPTPTNYKIAFASDWGCESETDDVIDLINDNGYDIIVSAGDNAYASASCFTNRFEDLEAAGKVYGFAYGNHEYSESGGISPYLSFFGHPRTYFTFKFQNFFFLIIDSNINMDPGSAQHNFILSELQRVQNDNTITWKAAIYHHPPYGSPSEHSYNDGESVEAFHSLFEQYGVQFILSAHNHNMQRSHQVVRNNSNPESPTVVDSSPPFVGNNHTVIEVISGAGGHDSPGSLYDLGNKPSFMAYQSNAYNGLWEMIASNNGNTLTCSFVDTDGNKYDTFVINAS
jgi:hypothetical protein